MSHAETREPEGREAEPAAQEEAEQEPVADPLVQPERVRVWEDEYRELCISVDGRDYTKLRPCRAFPLSAKADYVSFLDKKDKEKALLAHPHKLDKESRRVLDRALARMYYVARITRIDSIKETWGVSHWEVETDRGYASFEVADRNKIRKMAGGRLVITDADGNRFEVEDVAALDSRSQALIFRET